MMTAPPATAPPTMTAAVARRFGTSEQIAIEEVPTPTPGKGEVLIEVRASSLNALDWHFLTGTPYLIRFTAGLRRPRRLVHGADVAGVVVAAGPGVIDVAAGDQVFGECKGGGCGPYLCAAADAVVPIPEGVDFEAAGATPVAGLTAVQALRTHARLQPGEHVLVNGAAGGVGTFAVQIAKAMGARVTAVCSTGNVEMVRRLGADEVVDYTTDDFVEGGPRFDVLMDNVGNRTADDCRSVLRSDGRYVMISGPKESAWLGPMGKILANRLAFRRASQSFHQFTAAPDRGDLRFLGELLADGRLRPEIQRTVGLEGVAEALAEIGTGHTRAKIVVIPSR